jgi:hypothetical protein
MASELIVQTLKGPTTGANANKVIIPSGQTLDASAADLIPASGQIIQIVRTELSTQGNTSSTSSYVAFGDASITPKYASSSILILGTFHISGAGNWIISRGGTNLYTPTGGYMRWVYGANDEQGAWNNNSVRGSDTVNLIDTPNTTDQVTYSLKMKAYSVNNPGIGLNELTANTPFSGMTLMEIAG